MVCRLCKLSTDDSTVVGGGAPNCLNQIMNSKGVGRPCLHRKSGVKIDLPRLYCEVGKTVFIVYGLAPAISATRRTE